MDKKVLFPVGGSDSTRYAAAILSQSGFLLTDHPSPDITHLLLGVPSFRADGKLTDGCDLKELLRMLPKTITVIGYGLEQDYLTHYCKIDLLKDPLFLSKNAAITAECALQTAMPYLSTTLKETPTLILGWGRIGKCLTQLLAGIGCPVTVAARKEADRAMLEGLGHRAVDFSSLEPEIARHKLLFNTVPKGICLEGTSHGCTKIDLASLPGLQGNNVITARGLPGKYAPESAGKLIAECVCRLDKEER